MSTLNCAAEGCSPTVLLMHACVLMFTMQILRLGFDGYKRIMTNLMRVAGYLQDSLLATGAGGLLPSSLALGSAHAQWMTDCV